MERALARLLARGSWPVWLWFLLWALVWSWPALPHLGTEALGHKNADGMKHLWTLWWMRASVWTEGSLPYSTELVNWPQGLDLFPIEPLHGIVAVLLPFVSVVVLSNLLAIANLCLTGVAGAWFGRQVSGTLAGGLAAGMILQSSSIMAFFLHVGVGELWHLWWLPLGLGCLVRARASQSWRDFGLLGACLVGATLSCFYHGLFLALATLVWALVTFASRTRAPFLLGRYALTAALSFALVYPVMRSFRVSYEMGEIPDVGFTTYVFTDFGQTVVDAPSSRLDPAQLLSPRREPTSREEAAYSGGRYLGIGLCLLALAGLIRRPREGLPWLAVALVGLVLAPGSELVWKGMSVNWEEGAPVRLPMLWLNRALAFGAEPLNFPVRFLAITITALAALASLALRGWGWLLGLLAALEITWGQMLDFPRDTFRPQDSEILVEVEDHRGHAMVDLALQLRPDNENRSSALAAQMVHNHPIQAVPIERVEFFARDGVHFVGALPVMNDLQPVYEGVSTMLGGDYRPDWAILRDAGFEEVLLNYRGGREAVPEPVVTAISGILGPPLLRGGATILWGIPEVEFTEEELAAWKVVHAQRVASRRTGDKRPAPSW